MMMGKITHIIKASKGDYLYALAADGLIWWGQIEWEAGPEGESVPICYWKLLASKIVYPVSPAPPKDALAKGLSYPKP